MIKFLDVSKTKMDWKTASTIIVTTLLIVVDHYHGIFREKWMDHTFLFLVIPVALVMLVYRQSLSKYGFRIGNWKSGLLFTLGGWVFMTVIMLYVAKTSDFQVYYGLNQESPSRLIFTNAMDLFGWEFIFRGLLLFTLFPICGPYAILLQAVPFTIAHFGKPELETISCIFGGPILGYIGWRTRSFLYPFLIHWYLTTITILLARSFI
jgi:membrane protease YdiL (CAAX protease family)